jgi:hypothetical protein
LVYILPHSKIYWVTISYTKSNIDLDSMANLLPIEMINMQHDTTCSRCEEEIELTLSSILDHSSGSTMVTVRFSCECTTKRPASTSIDSIEISGDLPLQWKSDTENSRYEDVTEYDG